MRRGSLCRELPGCIHKLFKSSEQAGYIVVRDREGQRDQASRRDIDAGCGELKKTGACENPRPDRPTLSGEYS
jgi:hypothetical protein